MEPLPKIRRLCEAYVCEGTEPQSVHILRWMLRRHHQVHVSQRHVENALLGSERVATEKAPRGGDHSQRWYRPVMP